MSNPKVVQTSRGEVLIRTTREQDAQAYRELRLEALQTHPFVFASSYEEDHVLPDEHWLQRVREGAGSERSAIYVAEAAGRLVGMVGIMRPNHIKMQHQGLIWGVYVRADWRGIRLSDALLEACIDWARQHQLRLVKLGVVTVNHTAIRSYVRSGFQIYGVEPEVIHYNGTFYDELVMYRRLEPATNQ